MENKHLEKKKLKNEIIAINNELKGMLGLFLYNVLVHKIELAVKSRFKSISLRHQRKPLKFRKPQTVKNCDINPSRMKRIAHAFSSYNYHKQKSMHCHMDQTVIPANINRNAVTTKFESFLQSLLRGIFNMSESEIRKVKTKLHSACEKY